MRSPIHRLLLRLSVALGVSLFLALFLWKLQTEIETKDIQAWKKFSLFVLAIYGAGFSWDVVKKVTTLPQAAFDAFTASGIKSLVWFAIYWILGVLFLLLLGPLAGWLTIFSIAILVLALGAGYKAVTAFGTALDAAIDEAPSVRGAAAGDG